MDWLTVTVAVTGSIGASIIGGTIVRSVGKYWEDKAAQIALGEITSKVETIKSQLTVLTNRKNVTFIEEKNSLIEYLVSYNEWLDFATTIQYTSAFQSKDFSSDFTVKFNQLDFDYKKFQATYVKLELFLNQNTLTEAEVLNNCVQEYHMHARKFLAAGLTFWHSRKEFNNATELEAYKQMMNDYRSTNEYFSKQFKEKENTLKSAKYKFLIVARNYITENLVQH